MMMTPEPSVVPGVRLYTVSYCSEGLLVKAALAVPESFSAAGEPLPALLYCRGNEGGEGRDEFGGADRHDVFAAYELLRRMKMSE